MKKFLSMMLALAMAMTMLCGGINLSIIATANACSLVMAWVATSYPPGGAAALATQGMDIAAELLYLFVLGDGK